MPQISARSLRGSTTLFAATLLRDTVNSEYIYPILTEQGCDEWHRICASMDVIEDATEALISAEEALEFIGQNDVGDAYLRLYGLLQAIVVQEDGIRLFCELAGLSESCWREEGPSDGRFIRRIVAGHPLDARIDSVVTSWGINRGTLTYGRRVQLYQWSREEHISEIHEIDLHRLLKAHARRSRRSLFRMVRELRRLAK